MNSRHNDHASLSGGKSDAPEKHEFNVPSGKTVSRMAKNVKRELKKQMEERPFTTMAVASGVTFALGAVVGTRIGRLVVAAAVPMLIKRALEGTLMSDAERWLRPLTDRFAKETAHN